jgi:hypothetical protein
MSDVEAIICSDCGKSKGNKGSITQWIGLGEQCHCNLQKAAQSVAPARAKQNQCRRCLKPKPTARQSMTQWLFKKDLCNCPKETRSAQPITVALPSVSPSGTKLNNILIVGGTIGVISLIAIAYSLMVLEVPKALDSHKNGKERLIVCSPTIQIPFNNAAITVITTNQYRYLTIKDCRIDVFELKLLGQIPSLEGLTLQNCLGITAHGLNVLVERGNLKYLSLAQSPLSQKELEALVKSKLETLDLSHTAIADADWACLTQIESLKKIVLRDVFVTSKNRIALENANFHESAGVFSR